jgi:hypothetical protein
MSHEKKSKPIGDDDREPPMFATIAVCPNCGHRPAVVFRPVSRKHPLGEAPLICLKCCPTADGQNKK